MNQYMDPSQQAAYQALVNHPMARSGVYMAPSGGGDDDDEEEDEDGQQRQANSLDTWGNANNMNLNPLIFTNITNSPYFKVTLIQFKVNTHIKNVLNFAFWLTFMQRILISTVMQISNLIYPIGSVLYFLRSQKKFF